MSTYGITSLNSNILSAELHWNFWVHFLSWRSSHLEVCLSITFSFSVFHYKWPGSQITWQSPKWPRLPISDVLCISNIVCRFDIVDVFFIVLHLFIHLYIYLNISWYINTLYPICLIFAVQIMFVTLSIVIHILYLLKLIHMTYLWYNLQYCYVKKSPFYQYKVTALGVSHFNSSARQTSVVGGSLWC